MGLAQCHNIHDFRRLARRRLPGPIFDYIDGGADDEVTYRRNTEAIERAELIPNVLRGADKVDLTTKVLGQTLDMPAYCSPTALQRLFHHEGERAVAAAAEKYGTMFGCSSLGTTSLEELKQKHKNPQIYQFYFHKDRGLNRAMLDRAKEAGVEIMMLTVDTAVGGNRERDKRTGFSIPFRLNLQGMAQFVLKPRWGIDYVTHERFRLPQLEEHVDMGNGALSIGQYFTDMLEPSLSWDDAAELVERWGGQFALKGVMSVEDAKRAADMGCTGVVLSNHGGRQLCGQRAPFDQLGDVVDAVGDRIDVIMDSGVQRGTHVVKALAMGAKAVGLGRYYLYPLAAAGRPGVERALGLMREEIERAMKLMGVSNVAELRRESVRLH